MPRLWATMLLFFTLVTASGAVRAAESVAEGMPARYSTSKEISLSTTTRAEESEGGTNLVLQSHLQRAGKIVLAAAFAIIAAGVVIIEVDPYSMAVGDWGFAAVGVGLGAFITSAFMLGLSRPVHLREKPTRNGHRFSLMPSRGLAIGYARTF